MSLGWRTKMDSHMTSHTESTNVTPPDSRDAHEGRPVDRPALSLSQPSAQGQRGDHSGPTWTHLLITTLRKLPAHFRELYAEQFLSQIKILERLRVASHAASTPSAEKDRTTTIVEFIQSPILGKTMQAAAIPAPVQLWLRDQSWHTDHLIVVAHDLALDETCSCLLGRQLTEELDPIHLSRTERGILKALIQARAAGGAGLSAHTLENRLADAHGNRPATHTIHNAVATLRDKLKQASDAVQIQGRGQETSAERYRLLITQRITHP
jgi:DNA-binding response OmpR family regulator